MAVRWRGTYPSTSPGNDMTSPRFYRVLRITASAVCGVVCVLMLVMWGRSYLWRDSAFAYLSNTKIVEAFSINGTVAVAYVTPGFQFETWGTQHIEADAVVRNGVIISTIDPSDSDAGDMLVFSVPYWLLVILSATLATLPWLPWRFSLKSMLIAVTLAAVAMGVVVYFARQ